MMTQIFCLVIAPISRVMAIKVRGVLIMAHRVLYHIVVSYLGNGGRQNHC